MIGDGDNRSAPTKAACREAQQALLLGAADDDATARVRIDRHVGHCVDCQAVARGLHETRATLRAAGQPLDDVHRARLLARLGPAVDDLAAQAAAVRRASDRPAGGARRVWIGSVAALAAAGTAVLFLTGVVHRPAPTAAPPLAPPSIAAVVDRTSAPAPVLAAPSAQTAAAPEIAPPAPPRPALIVPFDVTAARGGVRAARQRLVDQRFSRLQTGAGTTVRAHVGERTRVTLVGPADLSVASATAEVLDVNLDAGTLVADFVHRRHGRLRIHSPGALTEVVGTLFSVEVRGQQSRVSVAHGRVVVQPSDGPPRVVSTGQSWTSGTPSVRDMPATAAALLADHQAAIQAAADVAPVRAPAPAPAPPIAAADLTPEPNPTAPAPQSPPALPPARPASPPLLAVAQPRTKAPAAAPSPSPAPPPSPAPVPAIDRLYADAEAAMRRRDWPAAAQALERVTAQAAPGAQADQARYELAQLAVRAGDPTGAARWLDALGASDREPALRQPAAFLRCEVHVRAGQAPAARRCWEDFRARFPGSGRDALALGWLLRLAPLPPCATLRPLADDYLRLHPAGPDAALARQQQRQCNQ